MCGTHHKVCVVGGGLAGLATTYYLIKEGVKDVVIIEKLDRPAGLLRSEVIRGFTFDVGGSHIIFSKDPNALNEVLAMLEGNYLRHRRMSRILVGDRLIKYPFENGLKDLPPRLRYECLRDLINTYIKRVKGELREPTNFLEWLYYVFGNSIVNTYLRPYNEKLWKVDLRELTLEWVGGRVPNPPIEDIIKSAVGIDTEGYKHQLIFYYPLRGGIEALIKSLLNEVVRAGTEVVTNSKVECIERCGNYLRVLAGNFEVMCNYVVYTAPLNALGNLVKDMLSNEYRELVSRLRAVPLAVISLGIKGDAPPYHWVYIPQKDIIFHRVAFISNYSPVNAPRGTYSVIAEVSFKSVSELRSYSNYRLVREVIEGLEYVGFLRSESDVLVSNVTKWDRAYVIYDSVRSRVVREVIRECLRHGIVPHGRFGSWEYLNMDAVISKSKELAHKLIKDSLMSS